MTGKMQDLENARHMPAKMNDFVFHFPVLGFAPSFSRSCILWIVIILLRM